MDTNKIIAWGTIAGVAVAIITLWNQSRRSRFQAGIEILLRFNDQFESEKTRTLRKTAAMAIKQDRTLQANTNMKDTDDILDFFEGVALLVRRKAIDKEFVWHSFYYWLHRYYLLCQNYIENTRKKDKARWEDLCWLHPQLDKIERIRGSDRNDVVVSDKDLDDFIEEELT
jgi:hypothetical protein